MKNVTVLLFGCLLLLLNEVRAQSCSSPDVNIWDNTWQSCQVTPNPNPLRGNSHWIRYDFGQSYQVYRTRFWNHNKVSELTKGAKDIIIDYSTNGTTWSSLGTYRLPKADGNAIYTGLIGPDFAGVNIRYVLITIVSNWGHATCNGLAEVKFMLAPQMGTDLECDNENLAVNNNPILTDTYSAQNTITSIGHVDMANHAIFKAGDCIELNAGFEVTLGNTLCAEIEECLLKINP